MLGFCYFCATVLDVFTDTQLAAAHRAGSWEHDGEPFAPELATARQAFAIHPRAAWEATSRVRKRIGAQTLPYPEPVPAAANGAMPPAATTRHRGLVEWLAAALQRKAGTRSSADAS